MIRSTSGPPTPLAAQWRGSPPHPYQPRALGFLGRGRGMGTQGGWGGRDESICNGNASWEVVGRTAAPRAMSGGIGQFLLDVTAS